jgi:putative transposase
LAKSPKLWPHSTFHRYVKQGIYHNDWGTDTAVEFGHKVGRE